MEETMKIGNVYRLKHQARKKRIFFIDLKLIEENEKSFIFVDDGDMKVKLHKKGGMLEGHGTFLSKEEVDGTEFKEKLSEKRLEKKERKEKRRKEWEEQRSAKNKAIECYKEKINNFVSPEFIKLRDTIIYKNEDISEDTVEYLLMNYYDNHIDLIWVENNGSNYNVEKTKPLGGTIHIASSDSEEEAYIKMLEYILSNNKDYFFHLTRESAQKQAEEHGW